MDRNKKIQEISKMCRSGYCSLLIQLLAMCDKRNIEKLTDDEIDAFLDGINSNKITPIHFYDFGD